MKKLIALLFIIIAPSLLQAKSITVKENELIKLISIADEYMLIAKKDDVKIKYEKVDEKTLRFDLIVAKDLKHSNDLVYSFELTVDNAKIIDIDKDDKAIIFTVSGEKKPSFDIRSFTYGASAGIVTTLVIVLIIVL